MTHPLLDVDPDVAEAIDAEVTRQQETLELIASENFVSPAVLAATGTVMTNKYAEGYPGRRYYGGCENVDVVERLARDRACERPGGTRCCRRRSRENGRSGSRTTDSRSPA